MKFDWQAFADGSLNPEDMARHEAALASDETAAADYQAFQRFRAQVRQAVMAATVAPVPRRAPAAFRFAPWVAAGAAAIALALAFVPRPQPELSGPDPMAFATSPAVASAPVRSAEEASSWVAAHAGMEVPRMQLATGSRLDKVSRGEDWACVCFQHDGIMYHLYIRTSAEQLRLGKKTQLSCGLEAYVGRGVGWEGDGVSYYLCADEPKNLMYVASLLAPQTRQASG